MTRAPTVGLVVLVLAAACGTPAVPVGSEKPEPDATITVSKPPPGDAAVVVPADTGAAVAPADSGAAVAPADAGEAVPVTASCDEIRPRRPGAILEVNVELTYAGKPITFGEPVALPVGTLTLTSFRFYLAEVSLLAGSQAIPADLVAASGAPVPYNTHLVTADDPAGMTFRLAAPAGNYDGGLSFVFGLSPACDQMNPATSKPPLTSASQMDWPRPFGYLFLRYGARIEGTPVGRDMPGLIHMGGFPGLVFAPRVTAPGSVRILPGGDRLHLRVDIAELLKAARMPARQDGPIAPPPGGGIVEGDALRQHAGEVSIFSVAPAP